MASISPWILVFYRSFVEGTRRNFGPLFLWKEVSKQVINLLKFSLKFVGSFKSGGKRAYNLKILLLCRRHKFFCSEGSWIHLQHTLLMNAWSWQSLDYQSLNSRSKASLLSFSGAFVKLISWLLTFTWATCTFST